MNDIALNRLRLVTLPAGGGAPAPLRAAWLAELAQVGFTVVNPEQLAQVEPAALRDLDALRTSLWVMKGGDVDYVPLFARFPDDVPDDDDLLLRRILGMVGRAIGAFDAPPAWLLDVSQYGADPITQFQTAEATSRGRADQAARAGDDHAELTELRVVHPDEAIAALRQWLHASLYAKSSIPQTTRDDLRALLLEFGVADLDPERLVFKENRTFVMRFLWERDQLAALDPLVSTPTDLLRLFAALTDGDVSLATPIKFPRFSRPQRRFVMACLERAPRLAEDLLRYGGLWKAVGRSIHATEHRQRFPLAAEAFDALRAGRIQTFEGQTQALIAAGDVPGLLAHLDARPGRLGRMVHELLRRFPKSTDAILAALEAAAPELALKNLLVMQRYFATINDLRYRTVVTKRGRIKVLDNNAKGALSVDTLHRLRGSLDAAVTAQVAARPAWSGTVWIDPALEQLTVPLQQRSASEGVLTLGRGSRLSIDVDKVVRLFVWWKQQERRTDLDLSAIQFDADFNYLGHISYTALKGEGMVHSGDLQSAPHGAAEFIDISVASLPKNTAYVASCIYRYSGEGFDTVDCRAGWMMRQHVDADHASFDIKTVAQRLDVTGVGAYCVPVLIDVRRGEAVLTDLYVGKRALHNNVEISKGSISHIAREVARFTTTRPTLGALVRLHAEARGAKVVVGRITAQQRFGLGPGCDFDVSDVSRVLSELL